jgi:hypothetical protein
MKNTYPGLNSAERQSWYVFAQEKQRGRSHFVAWLRALRKYQELTK